YALPRKLKVTLSFSHSAPRMAKRHSRRCTMKKAFLCVTFLFLNTSAIAGITVEWNLAAAEAVLDALSEGSLDDDALAQLAALHGNRALIEKVAWAKPEVDAKYFVDAIEH